MKININDRANLPALKNALVQLEVEAGAISTIEKALERGMTFRSRADLEILDILPKDLRVIAENVEFGPSETDDKNLKRIEYIFKPFDNEKFFYGYQFVVIYTNNDRFTVEQSYPIEDQGIVVIDINTADILDDSQILFRVKTAQGKYTNIRLGEEDIEPSEDIIEVPIPNLEKKIILVKVDDLTLMEEVTPIPSSYRIRGKLLSNNGETKLDGYQIVIYAATANLPDGTPDFLPVAFATTETNGYFVTSYLAFTDPDDITKVKEGQATIVKEGLKKTQHIRLIKKTDTINSEGGDGPIRITKTMLPDRLILVIEEASRQEEDCNDCGCNELNFYEKKVLEEYSYYTVVRTTEPAIIADELEEEKEINLAEIYNPIYKFDLITLYGTWVTAVPLPVFQKFQAIQSRQVKRKTFTSFMPGFNFGTVTATPTTTMLPPGNRVGGVMGDIAAVSNVPTDRALEGDTTKEIINIDLLKQLLTDYNAKKAIQGNEKPVLRGRTRLGPSNPIVWDGGKDIYALVYQAASIAHGHVLRFIQEWLPDGYSLGDLLYSLPLAPGQKKQIAVLDWERRESAANSQVVDYEEVLNNSLTRDRDINEVVNATLTENIKASSKASTGGIGFGTGAAGMGSYGAFSFGGLVGISGGKSSAGTVATQNAFRESTGSSLQSLHDRTMQAASAVRSLRSTVVQTVSQGERAQATAESIANYNHCHAITIQYFEVLRHFTVRNRLAGVQECLFIPLQMAPFDLEKCLRWRNTLEKYLLKSALRVGFDAAERVQNEKESADNYYDSIGFPRTNYAEQSITFYTGDLFMEFSFFNAGGERLKEFLKSLGFSVDELKVEDRKITDKELAEYIGPRAIEILLKTLLIETDKGVNLKLDLSLLSTFRQNATLRVSMRQSGSTPRNIPRNRINGINIKLDLSKLDDDEARKNLVQYQNEFMKIRLRSGHLRYRTDHFSGVLFEGRIDNDIFAGKDGAFLDTSFLTRDELRNPRGEDVGAVNNLIHHLNENLEHYHKAIFFDMTPERRFMLLDGIIAPGKAEGRSVASVVENKVIGIAGNSLIMPVAPGYQLDPTIDEYFDMFAQYYTEDQEPMRISMPTHGVYAEAVMGQCNSCEEKDESRFWRWEESPIPDSPTTQILPINTDTRRADPGDLQPKDFPAPIVNIQNAPNAPDPTGLQSILQLIGKNDAFRDLTGLNQNQLNALAAYQKNLDTALAFGKEAAELAKTAGMMKMIQDAKNSGSLTNEDARSISKKTLDPDEARKETKEDLEQIEGAKQKGQVDESPAKVMSEDRLRKGQGIPKSTPTSSERGKQKYDITIYFKTIEGRPMVGVYYLDFGPYFHKQIRPSTMIPYVQLKDVELDPSIENPFVLFGDPLPHDPPIPDAETVPLPVPLWGEDFYHRATLSPTIREDSDQIVILAQQTSDEKSYEEEHEQTKKEIWERVFAHELGIETGAIERLLGGTISYNFKYEEKEGTETGNTDRVKYIYTVKFPKRDLELKAVR
jgi:hypothetical protein